MSRIDVPTHTSAHGLAAGRGGEATGALGALRIDRAEPLAPRSRVQARSKSRQLRALASVTQVSEHDITELRERPRDDVITRLSRILLAVENSAGAAGRDEIDGIFHAIINEHVRRLLLVKKPSPNGETAGC
jgi:hypothetical protein